MSLECILKLLLTINLVRLGLSQNLIAIVDDWTVYDSNGGIINQVGV